MAKYLDIPAEQFKNKPKVPPIIKPREITNIPGVKGTLPLRAGEVILSPDEQQRLRALGWKPGDPIPGNLPDFIRGFDQAVRQLPEEVRNEIATTPSAPPGTKPTRFPQPIDISQLSAEKRAEVERYLNEFKQHAPQIEKAIKARGGMDQIAPSVQKAIVAAEDEGVEVVDSRKERQLVDQALGTSFTSPAELQQRIDELEGRRACLPDGTCATEDAEHTPEAPVVEKEPEIDYADKAAYLTSIMAMKPFRKSYSLFGGRIQMVFRQLTTVQAEMVLSQVSHSARVGLVTQEESVQMGHLYWALLSLESVSFQGELTEVSKLTDDYVNSWQKSEDNEPTPLPQLPEILRKTPPLHHVSVWRAVQQMHVKFNALTEILEEKADSPDFWNGIEA